MRNLIHLALCLSLGACASGDPEAARLVARALPAPTGVARADYDALRRKGAATMIFANEAAGTSAEFVEVTSRGGTKSWRNDGNLGVVTRDGFLLATRGLGHDAMAIDPGAAPQLVLAGQGGVSQRVHEELDGDDHLIRQSYACTIENRGPRDIPVAGRHVATRLMAETCAGEAGPGFTNLYWVRAGRVLQARHWVSAGFGTLAMRAPSEQG